MRLIDISTAKYPNTFVMVDDADYEWLSQWKWKPHESSGGALYATRGGPKGSIYMHKEILKTDQQGDHIDGNRLNNQRWNLRAATHAQNQRNKRRPKNNKSGFLGVSWSNCKRKWYAELKLNGKRILKKYSHSLMDLVLERDEMAKKYHGEFAVLNFPSQPKSNQIGEFNGT